MLKVEQGQRLQLLEQNSVKSFTNTSNLDTSNQDTSNQDDSNQDDNPQDEFKKVRRREIERLSQQRQRKKKRDQLLRLQEEVENLQDQINYSKMYNRVLQQDLEDQQKMMKTLSKEKSNMGYNDTLNNRWQHLYQRKESQIPDDIIQNLGLTEISITYLNFISRLMQHLSTYEKTKEFQVQSQISTEITEYILFLTKVMVMNKPMKDNKIGWILDINFENLQSSNKSLDQVVADLNSKMAQLGITKKQKYQMHDLLSQHLSATKRTISTLYWAMYEDVKKLQASDVPEILKYDQFFNQYDILNNQGIIDEFQMIFFGQQVESNTYYYCKILSPDQLARLYILTYPYIPNIYLMMFINYVQVETENGSFLDGMDDCLDEIHIKLRDMLHL